ncbi:MAG: WG repeat-containing protein [Bacteroidota bacterium]
MKYLIIALFTMIFTTCKSQTSEIRLFQIFENGKIGFIDSTGKVVIKPVFLSAGEFSEGLASARINGTYGFIDATGNFVIKPQFDYATYFSEGLALAYLEGKPFFINKQGKKQFETDFPFIESFVDGMAKVYTETGKVGYIDKKGALIIDTVFSRINPFNDGLAVVYGANHHPYADTKKGTPASFEAGIIDTLGQFIVPFGKYENIYDFENGYFRVDIPAESWDTEDGSTKQTGFIDKQGKLLFAKSHKNHTWIEGNLHSGLAKINLYKYWIPEEKGVLSTSTKNYSGFINTTGEIVIDDTNYTYAEEFSDNRAFVRNEKYERFIIDTKGKRISDNVYSYVLGERFNNGVAFVKKNGKYGLIDTNENFIIQPRFEGIDERGMTGDYFYFYDWNPDNNSHYDKLYGMAKKDGSIIIQPVMQQYDFSGFYKGVLRCMIGNKVSYINTEGKTVWQKSPDTTKQISKLNIDFMNRGYFYAYSKPHKNDLGGHGNSRNIPVEISESSSFPENTLSLIVSSEAEDTISLFKARKVFVANTSKNNVLFNAQDSRLSMKVQAKNKQGEWKDIEYLPSSWCGNSYHTLTLEPNYYWTFLTPVYEGDFKTKLRIELQYANPDKEVSKDKKEITVYSNEFESSINPGQFWRQQQYYPNGIMDPYNN